MEGKLRRRTCKTGLTTSKLLGGTVLCGKSAMATVWKLRALVPSPSLDLNPWRGAAPAARSAACSSTVRLDLVDGKTHSKSLRDSLSTGQLLALVLMYIGYVASTSSSSSIEVALPALAMDPSVHLDAAQLAQALAAGQMATVLGKFGAGFAVDWRGDSAFAEALMATGTMLLGLVLALQAGWLSVALGCFVMLKLCKAAVGPAKTTAAKRIFPSCIFARVWGVLVTSSRVGATCGGFMLAPLVAGGWYYPPVAVGVFMIVMGVGSLVGLRAVVMSVPESPRTAKSELAAESSAVGMRELMRICLQDRRLMLLLGSETMLLALVDISGLIPLYISTSPRFQLSLSAGAALSAAYPAGMAVSTLLAGFAYDAAAPAARVWGFLATGLAGTCAFLMVGAAETPESLLVGLFAAGAAIAPAKYILPTIYLVENAPHGHAGKLLSLKDVPGYFCSCLLLGATGHIVGHDGGGWPRFFALTVRALHFPFSHSFSHTHLKSPCAEQGAMMAVSTVCICMHVLGGVHHQGEGEAPKRNVS